MTTTKGTTMTTTRKQQSLNIIKRQLDDLTRRVGDLWADTEDGSAEEAKLELLRIALCEAWRQANEVLGNDPIEGRWAHTQAVEVQMLANDAAKRAGQAA